MPVQVVLTSKQIYDLSLKEETAEIAADLLRTPGLTDAEIETALAAIKKENNGEVLAPNPRKISQARVFAIAETLDCRAKGHDHRKHYSDAEKALFVQAKATLDAALAKPEFELNKTVKIYSSVEIRDVYRANKAMAIALFKVGVESDDVVEARLISHVENAAKKKPDAVVDNPTPPQLKPETTTLKQIKDAYDLLIINSKAARNILLNNDADTAAKNKAQQDHDDCEKANIVLAHLLAKTTGFAPKIAKPRPLWKEVLWNLAWFLTLGVGLIWGASEGANGIFAVLAAAGAEPITGLMIAMGVLYAIVKCIIYVSFDFARIAKAFGFHGLTGIRSFLKDCSQQRENLEATYTQIKYNYVAAVKIQDVTVRQQALAELQAQYETAEIGRKDLLAKHVLLEKSLEKGPGWKILQGLMGFLGGTLFAAVGFFAAKEIIAGLIAISVVSVVQPYVLFIIGGLCAVAALISYIVLEMSGVLNQVNKWAGSPEKLVSQIARSNERMEEISKVEGVAIIEAVQAAVAAAHAVEMGKDINTQVQSLEPQVQLAVANQTELNADKDSKQSNPQLQESHALLTKRVGELSPKLVAIKVQVHDPLDYKALSKRAAGCAELTTELHSIIPAQEISLAYIYQQRLEAQLKWIKSPDSVDFKTGPAPSNSLGKDSRIAEFLTRHAELQQRIAVINPGDEKNVSIYSEIVKDQKALLADIKKFTTEKLAPATASEKALNQLVAKSGITGSEHHPIPAAHPPEKASAGPVPAPSVVSDSVASLTATA